MSRMLAIGLVAFATGVLPVSVLAQHSEPSASPKPVIEVLSDKTIRFDSDEFGTGVQYFGLDGSVFLWFPGQRGISVGKWSDGTFRLTSSPQTPDSKRKQTSVGLVCFRFSSAPRSRPTGKRFGPYKCIRHGEISAATQEVADGDVLHLRSGKVPCRLCRPDMTLSQLGSKISN